MGKEKEQGSGADVRHYIFWHDADTHIMEPSTGLESFVVAAGYAPVIFTDNALSLNNGVFFLESGDKGKEFFKAWAGLCKKGEWPWADNGCMYPAMLRYYHKEKYSGTCDKFKTQFDANRPEPPTGKE